MVKYNNQQNKQHKDYPMDVRLKIPIYIIEIILH